MRIIVSLCEIVLALANILINRNHYKVLQLMTSVLFSVQAALRAYKEDIGNNPDLTGAAFAELAREKNADIILKGDKKPPPPPPQKSPSNPNSKWHEAKSKDGNSYYYHIETKGDFNE